MQPLDAIRALNHFRAASNRALGRADPLLPEALADRVKPERSSDADDVAVTQRLNAAARERELTPAEVEANDLAVLRVYCR